MDSMGTERRSGLSDCFTIALGDPNEIAVSDVKVSLCLGGSVCLPWAELSEYEFSLNPFFFMLTIELTCQLDTYIRTGF